MIKEALQYIVGLSEASKPMPEVVTKTCWRYEREE